MVSASFVYVTIYTLTNLMVALYLQKTVTNCKESREIPIWAGAAREFLDKLGEASQTKEFEFEVDETGTETVAMKKAKKFLKSCSSMDHIQLTLNKAGAYEMKDEYELKAAQMKLQKEMAETTEPDPENTENDTLNPFGNDFLDEIMEAGDGKGLEEEFQVRSTQIKMKEVADNGPGDREITKVFVEEPGNQ